MTSRTQPSTKHTPTPWFMSGVRFRMNGGEWHSINRYDEATKRDENVACVGYDPRTGLGLADAHFIVTAVNSHAALSSRVEELESNERAYEAALGQQTYNEVAEHIAGLETALRAAGGYLRNASIDLSTGCTKATAIKTIEGGLKLIAAALTSHPEVSRG